MITKKHNGDSVLFGHMYHINTIVYEYSIHLVILWYNHLIPSFYHGTPILFVGTGTIFIYHYIYIKK